MLRCRIAPVFLTSLFLASALAAETLTFELDPEATFIGLTFGATLHTVDGALQAKHGTLRINPETGVASGWIVLDATSARTGNSRRDRKMHDKILESRRFPDIVFDVQRISGSINRTGNSDLQLHGYLDFHGDRRLIDLPVLANTQGDKVTATASLLIPYVQWGLKDPSFLLLRVEKEVRVTVKAVGRLKLE
jgi:polyisoprenoid-binding protein YceI